MVNDSNTIHHCLNCERPESVIPLVNLRYSGAQAWICSQCLPLLIHQPQELAGKLSGAENLAASPHDHD